MKTDEKLSVKIIRKVVFISIILICLFTVGVMASKSEINYVTIVFPEDCETTVVTSKVVVSDILAENHIIVLPDEVVYPSENAKIDATKTITISKVTEEKKVKITRQSKSVNNDFKYVEELLREKLDTKVRIRENKIEISFTNVADLNRILDTINVKG